MPKWFPVSCALLVVSTGAFAQPKGTAPAPESSFWDQNGSVVSLLAQGSSREFRYKEPRPGVLEAGARPGYVLFRGKVMNGQYTGMAFMFDRRCGQISYAVSGPILDNDQRVVLTGDAPLVGAKCRVQGHFTEVLEFRLLNANRTARTAAPESAPSPPLQSEEQAAVSLTAPAPSGELQSASPNPPADQEPAQKEPAAARPPPSPANPPLVTANHAPAQKEAAAPPPLPSPNPPPIAANHASPPQLAPKPDVGEEIERTRAARERAAAAMEAARAAELAAHRAFAEAEATRAAAEARLQQSRDDLQAVREENSDERSRQALILAAMSLTLLLSGAAIVLLIAKLRRSQAPREAENRKTEGASAARVTVSPLPSRWPEIAPKAGTANAAKSHGYQSGGRTRVFFQTRPAHHSGDAPRLGRAGYPPR